MQYIIVTGRISGKSYLVPLGDIGLIRSEDEGTMIFLKTPLDGGGPFSIKKVDCIETLPELLKEINSLQ